MVGEKAASKKEAAATAAIDRFRTLRSSINGVIVNPIQCAERVAGDVGFAETIYAHTGGIGIADPMTALANGHVPVEVRSADIKGCFQVEPVLVADGAFRVESHAIIIAEKGGKHLKFRLEFA